MEIRYSKIKQKLFDGVSQWVKLNLLLLALNLILRISFFGMLFISNNVDFSSFLTILSGIYFDIFLVFEVTALLLIPFLIFYIFIPRIIYGVSIGLITIYCILYGCLIGYYNNVMLPLDRVFFVYDANEMMNIITSSVRFSILPIIAVIVVISLYFIFIRFWNRKVNISKWLSMSFTLMSVAFAVIFNYNFMITNDKQYKSYSDYCLATNQMSYTLNAFKYYYEENEHIFDDSERQYDLYDKTVIISAIDYQALFPEFTYIDSLYPFMRLSDDKDVLGDYFNKTTDNQAPNFVFLIIESLGRNLTAFQPQMSYTPFIDSLASKGLFWQNCLALSERTFGVLPNIFSSAPYDKTGFARPWFPIPDHNSILKDMSKNNYTISYYYGGNSAFDGQDEYLSNNGVSYIMQPNENEFDKESMELMKSNNSWGIYDGDMFKAAMKHKDSLDVKRPFTDIYLTLSTHEPFYFKGIEEYEKRVVEMLEQCPDVKLQERKTILDNKNVYACYLYIDDCIRMLVNYYRQSPEFENTIFVITGDHRMGRLYVNTSELLKYNVPLIIYSPLLKSPKNFKSVVTHHDITPSLNAYLRNNYDYIIDSVCHWIGNSLDTTENFSSKVIVPFMRNSREIIEFLFHDKFIVRDRIYKIDENLYPDEINDDASLKQLTKYLADYKTIDWYVTQNDFLLTKPTDKLENVFDLQYDISKYKDDNDIIVKEMPEKEYYVVFPPITFHNNYEKIYIDVIFDYRITDGSKSNDFDFVFKMINNEEQILYKGYKSDALSSDILNEDGWKRLRVKTTCFFAKPVTDDAIMKFYLKSNGNTTLQIKDFNIKIDALPLQ